MHDGSFMKSVAQFLTLSLKALHSKQNLIERRQFDLTSFQVFMYHGDKSQKLLLLRIRL